MINKCLILLYIVMFCFSCKANNTKVSHLPNAKNSSDVKMKGIKEAVIIWGAYLTEECTLIDGKKNGKSKIILTEGGSKFCELEYKDDKKNGRYIEWDLKGNIVKKEEWKDGIKVKDYLLKNANAENIKFIDSEVSIDDNILNNKSEVNYSVQLAKQKKEANSNGERESSTITILIKAGRVALDSDWSYKIIETKEVKKQK